MIKLKPNQFEIRPGMVITERPILFNTEMVKANLDDRKTQTRRQFNQPSYLTNSSQSFQGFGYINGRKDQFAAAIGTENMQTLFRSKYGQPGDLLWVREKTIRNNNSNTYWPVADGYVKTADYEKTIPSIHMPKSASRIWLMIEEIRVERLKDITHEQARAEGIKMVWIHDNIEYCRYKNYINDGAGSLTPTGSFCSLWKSINGEDSWNENPWVWVLQYRILSKMGRPSDEVILKSYEEITSCLSVREMEVSNA